MTEAARSMDARELAALETAIEEIMAKARSFGLDFFPMRFEICPADIIYTFGAYAMPARFSHWSFGKAYHQMKTQYDYGLSKIYELVINSDPCYAFLLETNSLLQNKMIVAHVLAHSDFFKHNHRFRHTNRQMIASMAAFANRVSEYERKVGRHRVERFLDAVLSIHEHVDPYPTAGAAGRPQAERAPHQEDESPYADLLALDRPKPEAPAPTAPEPPASSGKSAPTRDLLLFLLEHAPDLEDWQRDILSSVRNEMLYFRPQMETKITNEGWASFWHARIMRELDLTPEESVEFARMHAAVLAPGRFYLNPYHLGFHIFEDIERRYGWDKLFEVRETEVDVSLIRNYLTEELCERLDLYVYARVGNEYRITGKAWERVRDALLRQLNNCGIPYIYVEDGNYQRRGELYLRHAYEGVELDPVHLQKTLPHVHHIWQRPVHLETVEDGQTVVYTFTGQECLREVRKA